MLDAVLGLNRPRITPDGPTAAIWRFLESLPTPRRNLIIENLRLQQVYDAIYAAALDSVLQKTPVGRFRIWFGQRILHEDGPARRDVRRRCASGCCSSSSARPT